MSFWSKLNVQISDLEVFKRSCEKNDVSYAPSTATKFQGYDVHAVLEDNNSHHKAYLVKDGGSFRVVMDADVGYSPLAGRLGRNGGKLTRDYSVGVVRKGVQRSGGMVTSQIEQADGSVVMRVVAVG